MCAFDDLAGHGANGARAHAQHHVAVLRLLDLHDEINVGELVQQTGLSQSALSQHLAKLRTAELSKGVDFSDPAQVKEYLAKLEKLAPTPQDPKEREIAELKAKLAKLEGKSNQSPTDGEGANELGLAKDEAADWNAGVALAKAFLGKKD